MKIPGFQVSTNAARKTICFAVAVQKHRGWKRAGLLAERKKLPAVRSSDQNSKQRQAHQAAMNGKQTAGVAVGVLTGSLAGFILGR